MAQEAIDKKFLAGLKYRSSKPAKEGGGSVPTERALTPADVLDWNEKGSIVTIVTADGQKYKIDKIDKNAKPGKGNAKDAGEAEPGADDAA